MGQAADLAYAKVAAFNAQDAEKFRVLLDPDVELAAPGGLCRGHDRIIGYFSVFWEAFPDLTLTITRLVEDGSTVITDARSEGTHQRALRTPGGEIPVTGRRINLPYLEHLEVDRNLIVSMHLIFDRMALLEQLGAIRVPAPA